MDYSERSNVLSQYRDGARINRDLVVSDHLTPRYAHHICRCPPVTSLRRSSSLSVHGRTWAYANGIEAGWRTGWRTVFGPPTRPPSGAGYTPRLVYSSGKTRLQPLAAQALTAGEISVAETHRYREATAKSRHSPGTPLSS
jgi:hypothetical protein